MKPFITWSWDVFRELWPIGAIAALFIVFYRLTFPSDSWTDIPVALYVAFCVSLTISNLKRSRQEDEP